MHNVCYGHVSFTYLCNTHLVAYMTALNHNVTVVTVVSARQNLQSALLCYHPPVRPSDCASILSHGWRMINLKRLVNIMQFAPHSTSFCGISFMQKFWWISMSGGVKQGWVGTSYFLLALCINILKTVRDSPKTQLMISTKLHTLSIGIKPIKVDDLGWPCTATSLNFLGISRDFADLGGNNS